MDALDLDQLRTFFAFISFVLGGLIGSFLNVVVYRMPRGLSVVKPRSRCPRCENPVTWYDNIPIFSWLLLRAKCRFCDQPISWQYPLVEGITAALFLGVFLRFGFTPASPIYMALSAGLVVITFVDLTDWTIPNEITYPGVPIGLACALLGMVYADSGLQLADPLSALGGMLLGSGMLFGLDKFSLAVFKKPGMGMGDVKLMAMLGAFFGITGTILIIVLSSFIGMFAGVGLILLNKKLHGSGEHGNYLPFGPSIAVAGVVAMFYGPQLVQAYLRFMNITVA